MCLVNMNEPNLIQFEPNIGLSWAPSCWSQDTKFGSIRVYLIKFNALTKINLAKTTEKIQFRKLNNAEKAKIPHFFCNLDDD